MKALPSQSNLRRISAQEWVVLAVAAALAALPAIAILVTALRNPALAWSGEMGAGNLHDDQQYLAWIRDASNHVLVGDLFSLAPPDRVLLHPLIALSGLLVRLGLPPAVAYLIWVPVSFALVAAATVRLAHHFLAGPWRRAAAIATALMYTMPGHMIDWLEGSLLPNGSASGLRLSAWEAHLIETVRGFPMSAMPAGLIGFALLSYSRARSESRSFDVRTSGLLLFAGWLQPWQGIVGVLMVLLGEGARTRLGERAGSSPTEPGAAGLRLAVSVSVAPALAIGYYLILGATDRAFGYTFTNSAPFLGFERWWAPLVVLSPLLLASLPALRIGPGVAIDRMLLQSWSAAGIATGLGIFFLGIQASATHALRGVTIPLSILAIEGLEQLRQALLRSTGARRIPVAAVLAALVAATSSFMVIGTLGSSRHQYERISALTTTGSMTFIDGDDAAALDWLRNRGGSGGVFADDRLAPLIPAWAGRQVWYGNWNWTPNALQRFFATKLAFNRNQRARPRLLLMNGIAFARATGARFMLKGCRTAWDPPAASVRENVVSTRQFGCAIVLELKPARPSDGKAISTFYGN